MKARILQLCFSGSQLPPPISNTFLFFFLCGGIVHQVSAGSFFGAGEMVTNRSSHVAVLLTNGQVLVAGGEMSGAIGNPNTESYSPLVGVWSTNGNLGTVRRFGAAAVLLTNGLVLITGGTQNNPLSSTEVFDPITGAWSPGPAMGSVRSRHTALCLPDGRVLVAGGQSRPPDMSVISKAQLYQSDSGTWTNTGSMANARYFHSAVLLPNGKVLVAGGLDLSGNTLAAAELYDPLTETWINTGTMNTARYRFPATLLPDGKVLVEGGYADATTSLSSAELYDPVNGTWTQTGSMTTNRSVFAAALLTNGMVLVAGGLDGGATAELYNPVNGIWTTTSSMTTNRASHTATLLPDGSVLIVGGAGRDSAEIYDPNSQTWTPITLTDAQVLSDGAFRFAFTNIAGTTNVVLRSTDASAPTNAWTELTDVVEILPGQFQFTDAQATNEVQNFYRVRSP